MTTTTRKVPVDAFRLDCGPLQFAEGEGEASNRIKMLARSNQPIEHWYWGRIVHDMSGMKLRKDRAPMDWCHYESQIIGYLDTFDASEKNGLSVEGELVSFEEKDRAAEVLFKGRKGVPYEASIDFRGPKLVEEVGEGITVSVNGYKFTGPGYVVREWTLNSVAVCPYGADPNTRTQFADSDPSEIEISVFSQEPIMPKETKPAEVVSPETLTGQQPTKPAEQLSGDQGRPPAEKPAEQLSGDQGKPPADGTDPRAQFAAELKKYTDKFGVEFGTQYFTEGKTWEQSLELHTEALSKQLGERDSKISELSQKVGAVDALRGEQTPTTFDDAGGGTSENRFAKVLPEGSARFAQGIKLPGKKDAAPK